MSAKTNRKKRTLILGIGIIIVLAVAFWITLPNANDPKANYESLKLPATWTTVSAGYGKKGPLGTRSYDVVLKTTASHSDAVKVILDDLAADNYATPTPVDTTATDIEAPRTKSPESSMTFKIDDAADGTIITISSML